MKSTTTFSITFFLKNNRAKIAKHILYARITFKGQRAEFTIRKELDPTMWVKKSNRVKGTSIEARKLNMLLTQISSEIYEAYNILRNSGLPLSAQRIKSKYLNEDVEQNTLFNVIDYHTEIMKSKHSAGTKKNYKASIKYVKAFVLKKYKTEDIDIRLLNYEFITKFESFLRMHRPSDYQKPMGNNTAMKHIQRLRKVINLALKLEWLEKDPFVRFQASYEKTNRSFLPMEDLQAIEDKVFLIPRLNLVKDLFVFSCYTGLAYIDVVTLTTSDLSFGIDGNKWIKRPRTKGGTALQIPLLDKAEALINKYQRDPRALNTGTLFPKLSNQKLNSYLKEIADLCGITSNLTFHVARHTFATTITLSNGVPIETVSKLLGHTKIATTQIYAKVVERKVSEDMNVLRSIINNKSVEHDQTKLKQVK